MAFVAGRVVFFRQLDPATLYAIHRADMDAGNDVSAVAVYWTGRDWLDYPRLPWMRSRVAFDTKEEAEAWLE
jgi:hypothetical protein